MPPQWQIETDVLDLSGWNERVLSRFIATTVPPVIAISPCSVTLSLTIDPDPHGDATPSRNRGQIFTGPEHHAALAALVVQVICCGAESPTHGRE
jgi:hypothetical protein